MKAATVPSLHASLAPQASLSTILQQHALAKPGKIAYRFLKDGDSEAKSLRYADLDLEARRIAALLMENTRPGDRVLLLYPPGLEFIAALCACLYSGRVAVPAYPPRANRHVDRLLSIASDAQADVALTASGLVARLKPGLNDHPALAGIKLLATDAPIHPAPSRIEFSTLSPESLALIQYTSGSTSQPKGVQITQRNLIENQRLIQRAFGQTEDSVIVGWLPAYHDMGLIGNILQTIYCGAEAVLMAPAAFLQKPLRWLAAISHYRATTSGGPSFAYELCIAKIPAAQREALSLDSWTVAFNGAEPVRAETMERFAATFASCGFRGSSFAPCYGLAESTLFVSGGAALHGPNLFTVDALKLRLNEIASVSDQAAEAKKLVGCGFPAPGHRIVIADPDRLVARDAEQIGEIWLAGPSVSPGYWGRAEESKPDFCAYLQDTGEGPFLRTGDLGFLHAGELFITGRRKDLLIVRGRNHYPQDIELTAVACHPSLRSGGTAAFSFEAGAREQLAVVQEVDSRDPAVLNIALAAIRRAVSEEHELAVDAIVLVPAGHLPKTSSGKMQRYLCRSAFLEGKMTALLEWRNESESVAAAPIESWDAADGAFWLSAQLSAILGIDKFTIDADQRISAYGLDSLGAVQLSHAVEQAAGVQLSGFDFLQSLTVNELAQLVIGRKTSGLTAVVPKHAGYRSRYPLSPGQQALLFLHQLNPASAAYNIAHAVRFPNGVDVAALRTALWELAARHASLRTVIRSGEGEPFQKVLPPELAPRLEQHNGTATEAALRQTIGRDAQRPFQLDEGPPVRMTLYDGGPSGIALLFVAHHIITDFWSLEVLVRELAALYHGIRGNASPALPANEYEYSDYISWQAELLSSGSRERLAGYWRNELAGAPPVLSLPIDLPRPSVQSFRGANHHFQLDALLSSRLQSFAARRETTLFTVLLAAWQVFLSRLTGQKDIVTGSPASGRSHAAFRDVTGYFVNPVVIRGDLSSDPGFSQFVSHLRAKVSGALAHQDLPFPTLVDLLHIERDPGRSPLFQSLFTMQKALSTQEAPLGLLALGEPEVRFETGELVLESIPLDQLSTQFDISLQAAVANDRIAFNLQYNSDLFLPETAQRMAAGLTVLIDAALDSEAPVSTLPIVSTNDKQQLHRWNDTQAAYPLAESLHGLIEAQVRETPHAPAIRYEGCQLSYDELNARANRIAHRLRMLGVGPESLVGVCMDRSLALVPALLGVLKAGAAYLPLDPSFPPERLALLIADSGASVLIAQESAGSFITGPAVSFLSLDSECQAFAGMPDHNPCVRTSPDNLVYVIYTSGSTGTPKGASNTHRGICNRLQWMQSAYPLTVDDSVLQKTPFGFDVSVWEFFWPLMTGACLVVARPEGHRDPAYLSALIQERAITTIHFVPSMLQAFLEEPDIEKCISLRRVIASGESLSRSLVQRFFSRLPADLQNLYGPTEAAVDVTSHACRRGDSGRGVPIGRPIANVQIHLLDAWLQPAPIGSTAELYIGGTGVGRGYHRRPDLTGDRFVPDPFSPQPGSRLYRTGDLARFLPDGEIEFLGRTDFQVKVRGFRIEPGEIEEALLRHPSVAEAVVTVGESTGQKSKAGNYRVSNDPAAAPDWQFRPFLKAAVTTQQQNEVRLVAYVVCRKAAPERADLRRFLHDRLPEYMVPSDFVFIDALPLSPNGKLDRRALPQPAPQRSHNIPWVAPGTPVEIALVKIWSDVLGVDRIGANDNYYELGGDSIRSLRIRARARQQGLLFSLQDLMRHQTVQSLSQHLEVCDPAAAAPAITESFALISPDDRNRLPAGIEDAYPFSRVQAGLIYHLQFDPGTAVYHDIFFYHLRTRFDVDTFRQAVQESVDRHPILRTSFHLAGFNEPLQLVHADVTAHIEVFDWRGLAQQQQQQQLDLWTSREKLRRPDFENPTLMRFFVHLLEDNVLQMVLSFYDVLMDGWSEALLVTELLHRYSELLQPHASPPTPAPVMRYRDFVALERATIADAGVQSFWEENLRECVITPLPRWSERNGSDATQIRSVDVNLSAATLEALDKLAGLAGVSPKHVFLAAHLKVMSVLAGHSDVITGLESNGRVEEGDADRLLGIHINTLPFRMRIGAGSWLDLVRQTFATESELLPHRRYPLAEIQRTRGRQNLFDTVFNYTHFHAFQQLEDLPNLSILGAWGLERTNFPFRAEFNRNPFTGQVQPDLTCDVSRLCLEQLQQIAGYYQRSLIAMATDPHARHDAAPLLSASELSGLSAWNETKAELPDAMWLCRRIEEQARLLPHALAVDGPDGSLTYRELNHRAGLYACRLAEHGVGPHSFVGISLSRSASLIVAVVAVLKAGATCVPLDPAYPSGRLAFMMRDADISVLLTDREIADSLPQHHAPRLYIDLHPAASAAETFVPSVPRELDHPLYLIYTSGSTGKPKGVVVPYRTLINLISWQSRSARLAAPSRTLQFAPLNFDVAFQEIFSTLCAGGTLILISDAVRRDPAALLHYLRAREVERLYVPFIALQGLADAFMQRNQAPVFLRDIIAAGEQLEISPAVAALLSALPECRLHNHYGPSESHVVTTHTLLGSPSDWPLLPPIGRAISNTQIFIVDDSGHPVPTSVVGELLIAGTNVASGYLNRPALTAERFIPDRFSQMPGSRCYRTGDLARFQPDGEVQFLGRIDRQVKIRGFRVEIGEVEAALAGLPGVRECAVAARDDGGVKRLAAYLVMTDGASSSANAARAFLKAKLPDYMLPSAVMFLDRLPRTPSGKLHRELLPGRHPVDEITITGEAAAATPVEDVVIGLWARVLGRTQASSDDNFFESGGDSLLATQLMAHVRAALQVDLPLRVLFEEAPTPRLLAAAVEAAMRLQNPSSMPPPVLARHSGPPVVSFAQQRLWFLDQLEPGSRAYNVPTAVRLTGPLNRQALADSLNEIVKRHQTLRTTFHHSAGEPVPLVADSLQLQMPVVDLTSLPADRRSDDLQRRLKEEGCRPFDLRQGPLLRALLFHLDAGEHVAAIVLHHIISDGWSVGVFVSEMARLYEAFTQGSPSPLPALAAQYSDFAAWQREQVQGQLVENQIGYWKGKLSLPLPSRDLPSDFPRPAKLLGLGGLVTGEVSSALTARLKALGQREGCTFFMTLLSAFYVFLRQQQQQDDLMVGADLANRVTTETEHLIGFFVNQTVLRTSLSGNPTFFELLARVRTVTLEAYLHQDLPFDKLVEAVNPSRERNRTPLFQTKFVLQNAPRPPLQLAGLRLEEIGVFNDSAKFDLLVNTWEAGGALHTWWEFSSELFKPSTILNFRDNYFAVLEAIAENPHRRVTDLLALLDDAGQQRRQQQDLQRRVSLRERLRTPVSTRP